MSLHLITGRANAGKTTRVSGVLRAHLDHSGSALLLLPAAPDVARAISGTSKYGCLGLEVRTFDDYLDRVWEATGDGRAIVGHAHRIAVLEETVRQWDPQSLTVTPGAPGIVRLLARLVQRAAESLAMTDHTSVPACVARDLADCNRIYGQLLAKAGFIERAEAHQRAVRLVDVLELPDLIVIDGFTGLTLPQEAFTTAAAGRSEVYVTLVHDAGVPATLAAEPQLRRLAMSGGIESAVSHPDVSGPRELLRIAQSLGMVGSSEVPALGHVIVSEAWGRTSEAARIAREAQDALTGGIAAGEIAVVYRDAGSHITELSAAFAEAGIAAEFDAKVAFRATPLGRALLMLLHPDSIEHAALMDLLASPYAPTEQGDLDAFDAYTRGRRGVQGAYLAAISWFSDRDLRTASFLRRVHRTARLAATADRAREWYLISSEMLAHAYPDEHALRSDLLLDAAAQRAFTDAIDALAGLGPALNDATLGDVLSEATVALTSSDRAGHVQVMGAERVRGRRYDCVILAGLNEGGFPRSTRQDVLSDPAVVHAFEKMGVDLSARSGLSEERLLFYQVVTRARHRLVLSTQTHDADGRSLRGSIFVDELLDLYRDPVTREYYDGEPPIRRLGLDGLAEHEHGPRSERRTLRSLVSGSVVEARPQLQEALRRASRRAPGFSEAARRHAESRQAFSASEIEAYLQCPFRWCVQRLVQPRELDDQLDAAAAGRLGHDIMRRFYEVFPERTGSARVTPELLEQAAEMHTEVAAECLARVRAEKASDAIACRTVVHSTLRAIERDATLLPGFVPIHHEWSFGFGGGDEPEDLGEFALMGRIDRLDSDGHRLVLTDYKSGSISAEHGATNLNDEGLVQLPLYLVVASRRLGLNATAGIYRSFRGGKPRGIVGEGVAGKDFVSTDFVSEDTMAAYLDEGVERARGAVQRMRQGDISQVPHAGTCPGYCPARSFCSGWRPGRG